jgi:hypothetical protein
MGWKTILIWEVFIFFAKKIIFILVAPKMSFL